MNQSTQLVVEILEVHKKKKNTTVKTARTVRKVVFTKSNGEQYTLYQGKRFPVMPHPVTKMPSYVIKTEVDG